MKGLLSYLLKSLPFAYTKEDNGLKTQSGW